MRCKNCGKKLKTTEKFCTVCGFYNDDLTDIDLDDDEKEYDLLEDDDFDFSKDEDDDFDFSKENEKKEEVIEEFSTDIKSSKEEDTKRKKRQFDIEDRYVEAYIGEDYDIIKNSFFNIYAAIFNWIYVIYRKMYIIGIVGLIISGFVIVKFTKIILIYYIALFLLFGFLFNKFYQIIVEQKINIIKKKYDGSDTYTMRNIIEEKGGVNSLWAIVIYFIFLIIVIINFFTFKYNNEHNTKYWKENSENRANCISFVHKAYEDLKNQTDSYNISEATCKVSKSTTTNYDIYLKDISANNLYYYYQITNGYVTYKSNSKNRAILEEKQNNNTITEEEKNALNEAKLLKIRYNKIYDSSKKEDQLIKKKENKEEKVNFVFSQNEVIR